MNIQEQSELSATTQQFHFNNLNLAKDYNGNYICNRTFIAFSYFLTGCNFGMNVNGIRYI